NSQKNEVSRAAGRCEEIEEESLPPSLGGLFALRILPVNAPQQGMLVLDRIPLRLTYNDSFCVNRVDRGLVIVRGWQLAIPFCGNIEDSGLLPRSRINIS